MACQWCTMPDGSHDYGCPYMSELIAKLRCREPTYERTALMERAADRIEQLEKENDILRFKLEALRTQLEALGRRESR